MAEYTEYHPLKFWLDPASIAEVVAHIQTYLVNNPINSTTEIETIIHDYLIAHPELIGGVDSVNGQTGEVVLTADNISAGENVTIKDVLDSLQDQIDDIVASIPSDYQQLINDVSDLKNDFDWNESYNADVSGILGSAKVNNLSVIGKDGVFQHLFHIDIEAGIKYTFGIKLGATPTQAVYFYIIDTSGNYIETSGSFMAISDAVVHTKDKTFAYAHKNAIIAIKSKYNCAIDYAYAECSTNLGTKLTNLFKRTNETETNIDDITTYEIESEPQLTPTSGYMSTSGELKTGSNYATLSVSAGDIYSIRAMTGVSVHAYVLIDNGIVIDYYTPTDTWETAHNFDIIYKVPADGTLYINTIKSYYIGIRKLDIVCDCQPTVDDNAKGVSDALELIVSQNLFVPTEYNSGYRQGTSIVSNESYAYTKPIWLTAGTYLYTSVSSLVGNSDRVYLVDKFGVLQGTTASNVAIVPEEIGSISEYGIYSNRGINKFTLPNDGYVSLNLGYVSSTTKTSPQISNFMLVSGSLLTDLPKYETGHISYYTAKNATINGLSGLRGKRAIFDGDSICQGITVGDSDPTYGFGWAGRIGNANAMQWVNAGIGGGVITSASNPLVSNKHSVVDNIDILYASYPGTDYYVFDGGCNDADLLGNAIQDPSVMGSFDPMDFSGSYDVTTFSGAFETIIYKAISHWKPNHIGYIIPQKMGNSNGYSASVSNYRAYYERAIAICEKWGIPYIDLWNVCYLNPKNPLCRDSSLTPEQSIAQGYLYVDSQHLSAKGYDKITPMIEAWMKTI